jgi:uncharacterized OsmC-like protein
MTMTDQTSHTADNGVHVDALLGARQLMTSQPELGQFVFRAATDWVNGVNTRTTVEKFFGAGGEQSHRQAFVVETDHPEVLAATDHALTPPELLLVALSGCITGTIASVAQHRGIQLHSVRAHVEGDVDVAGILGIDPEVRNGFSAIRIGYDIDADATRAEVEALVAQAQKRSAVYDIVTNPTSVVVTVR